MTADPNPPTKKLSYSFFIYHITCPHTQFIHAQYNHYCPRCHTWRPATAIAYGDTQSGLDICPTADQDYFTFSGSAGDQVTIDIDAAAAGSSLDSTVTLYDSDGVTALAYNNDSGGADSLVNYTLGRNEELRHGLEPCGPITDLRRAERLAGA